ncbi:MAG TPA: hypothetical protein VLH40_01165 [Atribacteraceae bacterium]|nr:hypothetical protein [Atribacteraceae bacterium]
MKRNKLVNSTIIVMTVVTAFFLQGCLGGTDLSRIERQRYEMRMEESGEVTAGYMLIETTPKADDQLEIKIDFKMGDSSFSQTMVTKTEEIGDAFGTLFFANPTLMTLYGPLLASQAMFLPLLMTGGQMSEGFRWETSEAGETLTYTVSSSETRFGLKAYWVEIARNGQTVIRTLLAEEEMFPIVVEIRDPEMLEAGQTSLYYELTELILRD